MKLFRFYLIVILILSFGSACKTTETASDSKTAKRYPLKGVIMSLDKTNKKASIKHEKIPGYMDEMTMDFEIRKPEWVWDEIVPGSTVTGDLVVDNVEGTYWLEVTGVIAPKDGQQPTAMREDKAAEGKQLVDFSLTNQDGKQIGRKDFDGKVTAITFIYSRCPLPEFCILMSQNFSDAANLIAKDKELSEKYRLLSISFDPATDTPEKLKSYGLGYLGKNSPATDFKVWQLAVGSDDKIKEIADFAGLRYEVDKKDKTQFMHSLRTLIVSPDGKVFKVLSGNDWKPADLISTMKEASGE